MIRTSTFFAFLALFLAFQSVNGETWKTVKRWSSPSPFMNGVGWDGRFLWHSDGWGHPAFYKIDPKSGQTVGKIYADMYDPGGIVCWQNAIWVVEENNKTLDGTTMWRHWIFKVSPGDGTILDKIPYDIPPDLQTLIQSVPTRECTDCQTEALTTDGRLLYVTYAGRFILTVNPVTKTLVKWVDVPWANQDLTGHQYYMDGVTWAFGHLFAVSNSPLSILEFDPASGAKLAEFKAPSGEGWGPEGLAFDGTSIYYVENTTNSCYRILLIDGYFR